MNVWLPALKNSHLEQLDSKFFALLSTFFSILKIEHLIKRIGLSFCLHMCNQRMMVLLYL
ncbi:hypothetical protein CSC79_10465 [Pseudoalteromonas sp. 3D05]|nr:hypothetical protein CSC79_10465 [Pseudoalteromonas sp. 3D05]